MCKMYIYNKNKNPDKSPRGSQSAIPELKCRAKVRISNTNVRTCLTFWLLSEREVARTRKLQNGGHWQPLIRLSQAGKPSHRLHHARLQNPFKQDLRHFFIRIKSCTWNQEAPRQFYQFSSGCLWLPVLTIRLLLTCFSKQPTANMLNITINSLLQNILSSYIWDGEVSLKWALNKFYFRQIQITILCLLFLCPLVSTGVNYCPLSFTVPGVVLYWLTRVFPYFHASNDSRLWLSATECCHPEHHQSLLIPHTTETPETTATTWGWSQPAWPCCWGLSLLGRRF